LGDCRELQWSAGTAWHPFDCGLLDSVDGILVYLTDRETSRAGLISTIAAFARHDVFGVVGRVFAVILGSLAAVALLHLVDHCLEPYDASQ